MKIGPIRLHPAEVQDIVWFRDPTGRPADGRFYSLSVQLVAATTGWTNADYDFVTRVSDSAEPELLTGATQLTASVRSAIRLDVTNLWDVGLKLTTAEASDFVLHAHAYFGDKPWPSA